MTAQTITRTTKTATAQTDRQPRWLTYPEAAALCTLSVSVVQATHRGREAALPCGRREGARLKTSDVEALIVPADQCRGWW